MIDTNAFSSLTTIPRACETILANGIEEVPASLVLPPVSRADDRIAFQAKGEFKRIESMHRIG
jgi:hypothetical protein